ncbi:hypothetical protein ACQUKI_23865 [Ralstonia pseudosolanacearum]
MEGAAEDLLRKINDQAPMLLERAAIGVGSFLTFDCLGGTKCDRPIHIWIYLCDWRLKSEDGVIATSSGDMMELSARMPSHVSWAEIVDCTGNKKSGRLDLVFSGGMKLMLKENLLEYVPSDDLLKIYLDEGVLGYSSARRFYVCS